MKSYFVSYIYWHDNIPTPNYEQETMMLSLQSEDDVIQLEASIVQNLRAVLGSDDVTVTILGFSAYEEQP